MKELYFKKLEELEFELYVAKDLNDKDLIRSIKSKITRIENKLKEMK